MLAYMDVEELVVPLTLGAWGIILLLWAGAEHIWREMKLRRVTQCPACASKATKQGWLGGTLYVWCHECTAAHSRLEDEEDWMPTTWPTNNLG